MRDSSLCCTSMIKRDATLYSSMGLSNMTNKVVILWHVRLSWLRKYLPDNKRQREEGGWRKAKCFPFVSEAVESISTG